MRVSCEMLFWLVIIFWSAGCGIVTVRGLGWLRDMVNGLMLGLLVGMGSFVLTKTGLGSTPPTEIRLVSLGGSVEPVSSWELRALRLAK